jgi:hypothetical protein
MLVKNKFETADKFYEKIFQLETLATHKKSQKARKGEEI